MSRGHGKDRVRVKDSMGDEEPGSLCDPEALARSRAWAVEPEEGCRGTPAGTLSPAPPQRHRRAPLRWSGVALHKPHFVTCCAAVRPLPDRDLPPIRRAGEADELWRVLQMNLQSDPLSVPLTRC